MPSPKPRGRQFFANPGPTNIPDSILRAIDRPTIDFMDPEFVAVYEACFAGVKRVFIPMHSVVRIDEVEKQGSARISASESGASIVRAFPLPAAPPGKGSSR